jgi:hypothetical protein
MLRLALLVLPRQKEPQDLGAEQAYDEADHDASEALVVAGSVGSSNQR